METEDNEQVPVGTEAEENVETEINENSETEEEKFATLGRCIRETFVCNVLPQVIVDHIQKYDADMLTQQEVRQVKEMCKTKSRELVAHHLLDLLFKHQDWYECLRQVGFIANIITS